MFCSVLASLDALPEFGRLVWSVMDLMVLLFFCGCFWKLFSEKRKCRVVLFDLLQISTKQPISRSRFRFLKVQIRRNSIHCFCEVLIEDSNGQLICFVILWVHGWGCCWGWWKLCSSLAIRDTLLGTVGLAGVGMDQVVLFYFCDFFWGFVMLKSLKRSFSGDIGLVVLSGLGSRRTHPVGTEGATMARRAPFPLSSIPAYIDQSMKLIVCLKLSQCKVAPSGLMVALRLVDGKLACLVLWALHVFFDIWLGEQMLEIPGEFAFLVHVGCQ